MLLLHSCPWQCASASSLLGAPTLPWPCGQLWETRRRSRQRPSPWPPSSPSPPPSTTHWSTCCASPTSASVSTETRPCWGSGSIGGAHIWNPRSAWEPPRSAARTWAFPHASQMDSRTAVGLVCSAPRPLSCVTWAAAKGLPASWLVRAAERWQSASSRHRSRPARFSGAATCGWWGKQDGTRGRLDNREQATTPRRHVTGTGQAAAAASQGRWTHSRPISPLTWTFATDFKSWLYYYIYRWISNLITMRKLGWGNFYFLCRFLIPIFLVKLQKTMW